MIIVLRYRTMRGTRESAKYPTSESGRSSQRIRGSSVLRLRQFRSRIFPLLIGLELPDYAKPSYLRRERLEDARFLG